MNRQSLSFVLVALLFGIAYSAQPASARSRTPWLPKQRDGNPDGAWMKQHNENLVNKEAMTRVDWVMFGDGPTANWRTTGKDVLNQHFYKRSVLNLGVDGDMTQDMLWRLAHGEVYGIGPKLITVMVGRENITSMRGVSAWVGRSDGKMLKGAEAVVEDLQKRCPGAKIVLLSNLHRGAVEGDPILDSIDQTNVLIKKYEKIRRYNEADKIDLSFVLKRIDWMNNQLAAYCKDKENVTYLDLNKHFLDEKGNLDKSLFMDDETNLNAEGYEVWAKAMAPIVQQVLGEMPKRHAANSPAARGGATHQQDIAEKNAMKQVDLVFIGDSITHAWDTVPDFEVSPRGGKRVWDKFYGKRKALNYGQGGDRTQQALWRMQNGPLDGISPKLVVLMMGVNNLGRKECTPEETADGLEAILDTIHQRCPDSHILHLATFPVMEQPYDGARKRVDKLNSYLPALAEKKNKEWGKDVVTFMSINDKLLNKDGTINKELLHDFCHPSEQGCQVWAESIEPVVEKYLGKLDDAVQGQEPAPVGSLQELLNPYPIEKIKPWRTLQSSSGLIDKWYDGGNFVRTEPGQRYVMLDVQGRGCLDRMWFVYIKDDPNLRKFDLLIYVDNDDQPTIKTDLNDFIDGKREPFVEPLVGRCGFVYPHTKYFRPSRYWNAPIGFHNSLKMIIVPSDPNANYGWRDFDDGKRRFSFMYQLTYRLCQPDVPVKVFAPKPDADEMAALAKIKTRWANAGQMPWYQPDSESDKTFETTIDVQAGKSATLWKYDSPGTLRELRIKLNPNDDSLAMRRRLADALWLDMTWDDAQKPQVSVPLGVFFLAPDFATDSKAICLGCRDGEYYSFLPMPFFKGAKLQLRSTDENPGNVPIAAKLRWTASPPTNDACLFHACRYSQSNIPKGENILMLDTHGAGHVVAVVADRHHDVENDDCWYFDGETTPSVYGTGTEDFFSFAWGLGDLQAMSLHGCRVPFGPPSKRGHRTDSGLAYRFHPFATYPFRESLRLSWVRENIQRQDPGHYSGIVYYYLSPQEQ